MRGWLILVLLLTLSIGVSAANCTDSDNGGARATDDVALKTKGDVKYGITTLFDTCITAEEDGVSTNSSKYLKEYLCTGSQRYSEIYDCVKIGYTGCVNGACVASGNGSAPVQQTVPACGNKILEKVKGEECDPPNKICFGKTTAEYGTCDANCKCKLASGVQRSPDVCGDGTKDASEDCEKDADCPSDHVCSSCKCVKKLTPEEIEAMKKNATAEKEEDVKDIAKEIDEKYKTPELSEVNLSSTNFSDQAGIKATSGVANFFKKIFGWIAALFE